MVVARDRLGTALPRATRRYALLVLLLAVAGLISLLVNAGRYATMADVGEVGRLILLAFSFLLVSYWAYRNGPGFVMSWYLAGLVAGGIVNIYFSFVNPYNAVGSLPFLYSRNGGGGFLALGITLGAWMWQIRSVLSRTSRVLAIMAGTVGTVAVAMSFSKTAMLLGALGLILWAVVLKASLSRILRRPLVFGLIAASLVGLVITRGGQMAGIFEDVDRSVRIKFAAMSYVDSDLSIQNRIDYYRATGQILLSNPVTLLFGVGYSGFYPSVVRTAVFDLGELDDDAANAKNANPHNSFLYYLAANGLFGFFAALAIYLATVKAFFSSVCEIGRRAYILAGLVGLVYLGYGSALPSMYMTEVMYLPVAVALFVRIRRRAIV
jgi:O-antigen ligase